jgi:hypothetical protein
MSTDYRALCAELHTAVQLYTGQNPAAAETPANELVARLMAALAATAAALAQSESDPSQLSDGFHTFAELYEHRHALCLALMRAMPEHCWFSWRHADGERCFGGNDWFIAGIELPAGESVTYHMPAELFQIAQATGAAELEKGRPWDGHSAADVVLRLKAWAALAQPEPERLPPRVGHILRLAEIIREVDGNHDKGAAALAEAILSHPGSRWSPTIEPVPVAERFEFLVFNSEYEEQAGGTAPTYAEALSYGHHYLSQYSQDGPHSLEIRRVEVLPHHALPLPTPTS